MEWSKIKNIVILLLALVNAFLLVLVFSQENRSARYQEEARIDAVAVLEKNGIAFLPDRIPGDLELSALEVARERIGEAEDRMAEALLGPVRKENQGGDLQASYTSGLGRADFYSSGRFMFSFAPGAMPLSGEDPARHAGECLRLLGFDGELAETAEEGGAVTLTFFQRWEGALVFSCEAVFTYRDGELREIDAQRLSGSAQRAAGQDAPLSTATVLIRFLAGVNDGAVRVCAEIREMTPGYQAGLVRPVVSLTPVWRITTDTGVYYMDGLTGEITPAP